MDQIRTPDVTPEVIDVMCNPIRWRAYGQLRGVGPMRALDLARRVEVSEASMIKHLEEMACVGFVRLCEEDEGKQPRWRRWAAIPGGLRLTGMETSADPDVMRRWMQVYAQSQGTELRYWAANEGRWPRTWREAAINYDWWIRLTVEELDQVSRELFSVMERWVDLARDREQPENAATVYASVNVFPTGETTS